jgi:hypothetical protein
MAFQVHRKRVAKQLHSKPMVPRPSGSDAHATIEVVELDDMVVLSIFPNKKPSSFGIRHGADIYAQREKAETQPDHESSGKCCILADVAVEVGYV